MGNTCSAQKGLDHEEFVPEATVRDENTKLATPGTQVVKAILVNPTVSSPAPAEAISERQRFEAFVRSHEVQPAVADDLFGVLTTTRLVLLLDDSGSMNTPVMDPAKPLQFGVTRWTELLRLAACFVEMVTSVSTEGIDVHFMNRAGVPKVTDVSQLAPCFVDKPSGGTPLLGNLRSIFRQYEQEAVRGRRILVAVITDGEPTDGSVDNLFNLLKNERHQNIHISLAECNDNEEEMAYLDGWDRSLVNFDNTDDYNMELRRVKQWNGPDYKFSFMDYTVKIALGSLMRKYFMLDGGGQETGAGDVSKSKKERRP